MTQRLIQPYVNIHISSFCHVSENGKLWSPKFEIGGKEGIRARYYDFGQSVTYYYCPALVKLYNKFGGPLVLIGLYPTLDGKIGPLRLWL